MKRRQGFGYIYVATNSAYAGIVKIGKSDSPVARLQQLSNHTGVPAPFHLEFSQRVYDYHRIERLIHRAFRDVRCSRSREFFRLRPGQAVISVKMLIAEYQREQERLLATGTSLARSLYETRKARGEAPVSNRALQDALSYARRILKSHDAQQCSCS